MIITMQSITACTSNCPANTSNEFSNIVMFGVRNTRVVPAVAIVFRDKDGTMKTIETTGLRNTCQALQNHLAHAIPLQPEDIKQTFRVPAHEVQHSPDCLKAIEDSLVRELYQNFYYLRPEEKKELLDLFSWNKTETLNFLEMQVKSKLKDHYRMNNEQIQPILNNFRQGLNNPKLLEALRASTVQPVLIQSSCAGAARLL